MYIHIKTFVNSKKQEVVFEKEGFFSFYIKEKAERNMANKKIIDILRKMHPDAKNIRIVNGHRSHSKLVLIE